MSGDRFFLDTNILVYANDGSAPAKQATALGLVRSALETRQGCISTQVLQEFFVSVTRKAHVAIPLARAQVVTLGVLDTVEVDADLILAAIDLHALHQLSFWDALIVKAASVAGCRQLYTEDLQHDRVIDGVRVRNPFLEGA
jgi:predicted nucleic acid-binding protein